MPVWSTQPVVQQPELTIVRWGVFELKSGDRHLFGWVVENREGRTSSRVESFDFARMVARTASGRVYRLSGPQGVDADGVYTLGRWLDINGLSFDDGRFMLSTELQGGRNSGT